MPSLARRIIVGREGTEARLIPEMYGLKFSLVSKKLATR